MKRTREHIERQEEELQVLGAIYMDDCKDMRKKKSDLPKVCLQLKPLQSVVDKEVHASVDLIVQYTAIYPDQSPKLSLDNVKGLSKVSTSQLQEELEIMAADLVGEVMVLQLAHHVQSFLHKHNIPRLSFYDQMMTNKREEQRRIEAAEKERLREQMEASKEKEEEEKRLIEAELMRREEILRKSRRRRSMIERGETEDQFQQSVKPKDTKENKVVSSAKDLPTSNGEGKVYPLNNVSSLPHSPKKVELSSSDHLITRRKKSSESLGETDTGSRIITFNMKGEHTIYCGRCLGQGSSGSYMYRGMDGTSGDLIVVGEWRFLHPSNLGSPSKINEVSSQDSGRLMKQITSIQQEIVSLTIRVNHPNLVHYLAVKVNDSSDNVVIQVLMEYVGGGDMSMFLRPGGIPVAQVKKYIQQLLESLWYLHGKSVVHKDLKLTNVMLDSSGNVRLADYSVGKRLSDLYHAYGMDEGNIPQPKTVEPSKSLSRPGKKGDVFNLGLLILSLLCGDVVEIAEVPLSLPADLQDFLSKCLNVDERERWSAYQLLQHSFIKQQVPSCVVRNEERITGSEGGENALATKKSEPEEPIPDFCYFSCVSGKSRLNDFEQLQFLGKGGFGNVIKVRNILDGGLYAIKRIPLNPKSTQFNRKITREVQLISRVNHENVVRYYNSWIEWSEDDSDSNLTDGRETPVTKAQKDNALPSPQNSNEDSLMKLNIVEAPSIKGTSDEGSWCSYVTSESSESESSSNSSICEAARQNVLSKRIGSSFGISESGSGGITFGNFDESFLQFGDLLDTESEDSEEGSMWPTTTSESSTDSKGIQYLYIQMEYCEKNTLRNLIDEGLFKDQEKIWRHLREIVDGLAHIHSQGIIHRDLKPVNLFLDSNGNIKIGDFGLATTHDISRDGGLFLETHASERPPSKESEGLHTSDAMTGKVGTTFYVAPELAQSSSRVKYSEKVDLYSLGIIFFEMCYRPLTTAMERAHVLGNVRMENIIFPSDFDSKRLQQQDAILKWLLQHKPDKRPTSQELLQSQYIPPKIEDGHLEEVLQHTLQSTKTTRYKRLVAAMFKQRVTPIQDVMYDDMNDMERPSGISYCNTMAQQAVHEKLIFLFRRHGAIKLSTSLLVPRTSLFDQFELAVSVMDHNGTIVTLPYDLRIPFARFVARRKISHMKRYDIGVVYRDKRALDPNPKELLECTFDIVSDSNEDQVPVAEVFLVVAEIIKEFPSLEGRNYFIRINHTVIMKSVFVSCGVPEEKHEELFAILQDTKTDKFRKAQLSELLENLQVSEQLASVLCAFLSFEGSVGKLKEQLPAILKGRAPTRASAQALRELEALQSHALAFGVKLRIVFNSSLVYNIQHFSGLIFQFVAVDQRKRKRGGVDILAAGGRYDKLISYFQRATDASHKAIEAVGVSIAFEKIVTAVLDDKETLLPYSSDVLVCSTGSKSMMEERMRIAQELWCAGVKTNLYYYDSRNLNSLEDLQNYCRQTKVGFMVLVKEQESGWVKVWSLKKEKMTEIRTTDLTEYISTKLASCRADAMDGKETGTKLPTHGSQTVSESILSSGPSFSYVLNVSFNTLEKVDKSIKKRHESQMLSKISPKVQQIGIKTIVEIIGVDLPGSVIRNMASQLELDGNYDSYEVSIARLTENTPTKWKKYIARVCDNVRELIQDKKMPMVFVYSLKDETYKAFY